MAAKKPMKKPVKRIRRFQEGGETADKMAGLAASNKDAPMGFFERLRMGNIDQEGSEAYNRLGAGRGRGERAALSELAGMTASNNAMPVKNAEDGTAQNLRIANAQGAREMDEEMYQRAAREGMRDEKRMAPSPVAQAQNAAILAGKVKPAASRPAVSKPAAKPAAVAAKTAAVSKAKPSDGGKSVVDRQNAEIKKSTGLSPADYVRSGKAKIDEQDAAGTAAKPTPVAVDETKLSLSDRIKLSRERSKSGSGPTDRRSVNERMRETFGLKKGGAVKKMASGGSVKSSTASKRGDGIALRGKTRGKIY
jgi:hypothetical protein